VNARDAMREGGNVTVETSNIELDAAYCSPAPRRRAGVVRDAGDHRYGDGNGRRDAPPDLRALLHDQGARQGAGLGLSTVFGIVQQSGGHIWVYSEPGKGTTFKVYFPCGERQR